MFFFRKKKIQDIYGFKTDQQGIISRYLKEQSAWHEHLENTKKSIIERASLIKKRASVVVLGSGWWLDVPVMELLSLFEKCYLVDIVHPAQIQHKASKYPQIELLTTDITGNAAELIYESVRLYKSKKIKTPVESFNFNSEHFGLKLDIEFDIEFDMVVSVNILNQLDILILDYLKQFDIYTVEEIKAIRRKIQSAHLTALPKGRSCLVTDFIEVNLSPKTGEVVQTNNLIYAHLPVGSHGEWVWKFDNHQSYHNHCNTWFKVGAYFI